MSSLEKAARAACEIDGGRWDDPSYPPHLQEQIRKEYLAQARAVLLAVREPENAHKLSSIGNALWRERIDAILDTETGGEG